MLTVGATPEIHKRLLAHPFTVLARDTVRMTFRLSLIGSRAESFFAEPYDPGYQGIYQSCTAIWTSVHQRAALLLLVIYYIRRANFQCMGRAHI